MRRSWKGYALVDTVFSRPRIPWDCKDLSMQYGKSIKYKDGLISKLARSLQYLGGSKSRYQCKPRDS